MTEAEPRSGSREERAQRHLPFGVELVLLLALALLLAVGIKALFVQAFYIPSGSMENTLQINDRIIVNELQPAVFPLQHGARSLDQRPEDALGRAGFGRLTEVPRQDESGYG